MKKEDQSLNGQKEKKDKKTCYTLQFRNDTFRSLSQAPCISQQTQQTSLSLQDIAQRRSETPKDTMAPYYEGLPAFLFRQLFYTIPKVGLVDLHGKVVFLTGATSGVGLALALRLAFQGAEVIAGVRSVARGEAARQKVLQAVPMAKFEIRQCDLASFDSVKGFLRQLEQDPRTFDLVILNAGVWCSQWTTSSDGFDISLQVRLTTHALGSC